MILLNEVDVAISRSTSWLRRCPGYNVFRRQVPKQRRGSRKSSKCAGSTLTDWKANWNGKGTTMTWSAKSVYWDQSIFHRYQLANLEKAWNIFLWNASRRSNKLRIWSPPIHLTHSVSGLFYLRSLHIKDARLNFNCKKNQRKIKEKNAKLSRVSLISSIVIQFVLKIVV